MKTKRRILIELFITFMKIGAFTIGGGYAMLTVIRHEVVNKKKWVEDDRVTDYFVLGQSLPGVIGINTATLIGYNVAGVVGGIVATLGMVLPSFVSIILIAMIFDQFKEWTYVQKAFTGIRAAVVALILTAALNMAKQIKGDWIQIAIAVAAVIASLFLHVSAPILILIGGSTGFMICTLWKVGKGVE